MMYVPPTVEITKVVLEAVIAASPIHGVELQGWKDDPDPGPDNNSDIWLNF
jgi:hypothetical protein